MLLASYKTAASSDITSEINAERWASYKAAIFFFKPNVVWNDWLKKLSVVAGGSPWLKRILVKVATLQNYPIYCSASTLITNLKIKKSGV